MTGTVSDENYKRLSDLNMRLCLLLGYSSGFICKVPRITDNDEVKYQWLMRAIEDVLYLDKPLPIMP